MPAVWTFTYSGGTHTLKVESWSYDKSRANGIEWKLVLTKPTYWAGGSIGQFFECYERNEDGSLASYVTGVLTTGADTETSPRLVILSVADHETPEGVGIEISGTDEYSEKLLYEGIVLGDRRSTSSVVYTANALLEEIGEECDVVVNTDDLTDYNVPVMHVVGQGLSLFRDLLELTQGWLKPTSSGLRLVDGGIDVDGGSASFALNRSNCKDLARTKRSTGIYNEATFERVSETIQGYGPENRIGFGEDSITLNFPLNEATLVVVVTQGKGVIAVGQGSVNNVFWKDSEGNTLNMASQFTYRGETPAASVEFNLEPSLAWGENDMTYIVEVRGKPTVAEVAAFEEGYSATYADASDQGVRRRLPFPEPFTSSYCPDQASALMGATRKVLETLLSYYSVNCDTTMNMARDVGQICTVTSYKLNWNLKKCLVEAIRRSGDANQEVETLELSRGAA